MKRVASFHFSPREKEEKKTFRAVSYTHLRAHETVLDLVCRLLLEKKNKRQKKKTNEGVDEERGILMNLEEWYFQTPVVTRWYLTMSFLITAGCALEVRF